MRTIDKDTLNQFLSDSCLPYEAQTKLPASGQREVYLSQGLHDNKQYIIKIAHYEKYNIARVQREIKILHSINSSYFPKIIFDSFIAEEILNDYYDNLFSIDESHKQEVETYHEAPIRPFYLTIENYIENSDWTNFRANISQQDTIKFIRDCFKGLELLWNKKIVHRDLKPANILIRPNNKPVIIDLGIAKSFNEGTVDLTPSFFKNPHTYRFASPEQMLDRKDDISYKTDQYSMGIIAYNILSNNYPFGDIEEIGPTKLVNNMIQVNYTPISEHGGECCEELESFIKKLLMPEPHQRFRTTKKIFQTLEKINGV